MILAEGHRRRSEWRPTDRRRWWAVVCTALLFVGVGSVAHAQNNDITMTVEERGEDEKATRITLDFVNAEIQQLLRFLSKETNLTIIASEDDIKGKKLSLVNLRNVTIPEAVNRIKSGLMQFGLTTIQTDNTLIITTIQKAVKMKVPVYVGAEPENIPDTDEVISQVIPLNYLDATEFADPLKQMVSESGVVFADATSNSVVITDTASNIRRIAQVLAAMDQEPEAALKVKVIQIKNAQVQGIERALKDLFQSEGEVSQIFRKTARTRDPEKFKAMIEKAKSVGVDVIRGRVDISSNEDTNQLVVKASPENIAIIEALVNQLDAAPALNMEFRVYRLKFGTAKDVVDNLKEILQGTTSQSARERRRPWWEQRPHEEGKTIQGIIGEVRIAADDRLNGIIVGTDPRNYSIIDTLIKEIDQEDRPEEEIRVFFLKHADATTLVQTINTLIQGQKEEDFRPWWWEGPRNEEAKQSIFGLRGEVNLSADARLNAVVAATSTANIQVLAKLISELDVNMPEQEWGTRIYRLQYGDAENIANILNSVYQGGSQQQNRGFFFFLPSFMNQRRNQTRGSLAGNVVAAAYPTINAVIISTSTAQNFALVEELLKELDVPTPDQQREVTRVFNLEYSNADQLANLLSDLWQGQNQGFNFGRFISRGFQPEQNDINSLAGKVRLFADSQTNSLVVRTRARYMDDVGKIIEQLDLVRGQVWIDITILEITLDDSTKLGLEMNLTEKRLFGSDAFGKGRAPGKNPLTGQFSADLNLEQEITGFSVNLATKEYMAFLRTLMRQNKVRTLSAVPLLVRDNQQATFSSGRDIPYLQSAQTSQFLAGQIFNFDFLRNIGINISITPHIARQKSSDKGKRTIGLDIQQVQASNFIEFTNFNAPVTEQNSIQTYIDAQDGQQIVIGGLKKEKKQKIEEKVPFLGDIPLLGRLFKRTEDVTQDSEIVVVLTPHIVDINDEADRTRLNELQNERFGEERKSMAVPSSSSQPSEK